MDQKPKLIPFNKKLLYKNPTFVSVFNKKKKTKIIFADTTATGRPCPLIDQKLIKYIMPYYSNTHSNAFCGILMKQLIKETREFIRKEWHLANYHKIFFAGNGATGATNHLVNSINYDNYSIVNIFITKYEHYSNHVPWAEKTRVFSNVHLYIINSINDIKINDSPNVLNILSINGCSNVNGCIYDLTDYKILRKKYNNTFLLVDMACCAPYIKIDLTDLDGIFVSMHKFLGATGCPGILIANEKLFEKKIPSVCGGGCVKSFNDSEIIYEDDLETRESAGTPNIANIIRILYVLQLKKELFNLIVHNDKIIFKHVWKRFLEFKKKYGIIIIGLNEKCFNRLPIISFAINNVHYNYIVVLLNDLFGIQTRGGQSCCGLYAKYIKSIYKNINGWCRVSFNYTMDFDTINYILDSIEFVIVNYSKYESLYKYNKAENLYYLID